MRSAGSKLGVGIIASARTAVGPPPLTSNVYMLDATNGANLLTIAVGHSLDTLNFVLGEFAELSAVADVRKSPRR